MKDLPEAIRRVMRRDRYIIDLVGLDRDGEVKVYEGIGKTDGKPPFFVITLIPSPPPVAVYGDPYSIEVVTAQVTAWHTDKKRAWQMADAAQDALHQGDYDTTPYGLMAVSRTSFPPSIQDRDTSWWQIPATYDFAFSREGVWT